MNARTYLESYERLYRQAQRLTETIKELELQAMSCGAIRYDQDRVISSPGAGVMGIIDRKVNLERMLSATIDELCDIRHQLEDIFVHLPKLDRQIAVMTWLEFEGSVFISQKLQIHRSTVFRRRRAVEMLVQETLDKL